MQMGSEKVIKPTPWRQSGCLRRQYKCRRRRHPLWWLPPPPLPRWEACHTILRSLTLPYESCSLATPQAGAQYQWGNPLNPGRRSRPPYAIIQLHAVSPPGGADLESSRCFLYFRRYGAKPGEIKEALFLYRILPMRKEKNERFFCALVAGMSGGLGRCGVPGLRKAPLVPQKSSGGAGDDVPGECFSLRPSF